MFVLHAGFRERRLCVWAEAPLETQQRKAKSRTHPYDAGVERLAAALPKSARFESAEVWLPTARNAPIPSSALIGPMPETAAATVRPWKVTASALDTAAAIDMLCAAVNPPASAGTDLAYWTTAMRFAGGLVFHQRFLPDLVNEGGQFYARWRCAFTGAEDDRRRALAAAMPAAARAMTPETAPETLLNEFLDTIADALIRTSERASRTPADTLHDRWVAALYAPDGKVSGDAAELAALARQLAEWRRPIAVLANAPFRLLFRLEEPVPAESGPWRIGYFLQSRVDPSLAVPAETVWNPKSDKARVWNQPGFQPREHLLFSLGQASGVCPRIEESLKAPTPAGYEMDAYGAHDFLTTKAMALEESGFGVMLPAWWTRKGAKARLAAGVTVKSPFKSQSGLSMQALLEYEWQLSIGGEKITLAELRALAKMKAPLVQFRGQWVQMNAAEIQAALDFWAKKPRGAITARETVQLALGAGTIASPVEFAGVTAEGWIQDLIQQLEGGTPFEEIAPPAGLRATLRPYQTRGYSWLAFVRRWGFGACLADDMGLGKTIQMLSLIQNDRAADPVLLVCPTSVVGNWQKEAARFTPELPVMVHHGLARVKGKPFAEQAARHAIVISSYALLHRDFEHLKQVRWAGVVLDEAQNIKNPETKQAIAARALESGYRVALTGTPVENNVGDLWSIMEFANPGLLGTRADFKRRFLLPIQSGIDPQATVRLKKLTGPFILRRLKTDKSIISDLPEKLEMKVFCTLTKEQASLYAAVVKKAMDDIEGADGIKRKGVVLATLARLKQVCNHPAQYLADNSTLAGRSGKLARLTEMIEEALAAGDKALIFSQFAEMGGMLRKHLQDTFAREVLFLHGGVPKKQRDTMVERFQEESGGPALFILSLKAGGTGLNLTRANHVFHFDRWWNPAVENQATDRAFRIGQKKNVQVHKFVCAGTLEEKIDGMIEKKRAIAEGVVGTGEGWLTELSTAELKNLFALEKTVGD
jgi:hypothetical protein